MVNADDADDPVLFETADGIAHIRLNSPETRNAVTPEIADRLTTIAAEISTRDDVAVIVLSSAGPVFCAGLDQGVMQADDDAALTELQETVFDLYDWFRSARIPVIAGAQGHAVGAGASLLCYCSDLQVMAAGARIWWPEVQYGVVNRSRAVHLTHLIGPAWTAAIVLLGGEARVTARDAYYQGLVSHLVDEPDEVRSTCTEIAETIATIDGQYGVIGDSLEAIYHARDEMMGSSLAWAESPDDRPG